MHEKPDNSDYRAFLSPGNMCHDSDNLNLLSWN
jgi:hypothetical protein